MKLLIYLLIHGADKHRKHEHIAPIHAKQNAKATSEHKTHERMANFTKRTHAQSQKSLSEATGYANAARSQTQKQTRGKRRQRARLHGAAPGPDERADSGFRAACSQGVMGDQPGTPGRSGECGLASPVATRHCYKPIAPLSQTPADSQAPKPTITPICEHARRAQ